MNLQKWHNHLQKRHNFVLAVPVFLCKTRGGLGRFSGTSCTKNIQFAGNYAKFDLKIICIGFKSFP